MDDFIVLVPKSCSYLQACAFTHISVQGAHRFLSDSEEFHDYKKKMQRPEFVTLLDLSVLSLSF